MSMTPEIQHALKRYLLTLADDELVLGLRDAEWTGIAPIVEEDVAFSSLAQDEIGHARLLYSLAAELTDGDADHLAYLRNKDQYYHAQLLEKRFTIMYDPDGQHTGKVEWAKAIVRRFLYDIFDSLRVETLLSSSYTPLANAMAKVAREERYHFWHGETWWKTLASSSKESRLHLEAALDALWPDALGLFEEVPGEDILVAEGILAKKTSALRDTWFEQIYPSFELYNISFPGGRVGTQWRFWVEPTFGGRQGRHGEGWDELYEEMTSVRRIAPEGVW
ncbi:MAG: phenylacetate-CoA oxygenase subunit PaaC [Ktedonobacteraceae bacterium]